MRSFFADLTTEQQSAAISYRGDENHGDDKFKFGSRERGMNEETKAKLDAIFESRNSGWQPIETSPKDGTVIELTWMENGNPQEIWPLQWGHIQRNGFFPGKVGMWTAPDGSMTWNDDNPDGAPTHWRPYAGWAESMRRRYLSS